MGNISQSISHGYDGEIGGVASDASDVAGNFDDASKNAEKFQRILNAAGDAELGIGQRAVEIKKDMRLHGLTR